MRFPPPFALARLGEAYADQRNAETIAQWEQYSRNLEYRLQRCHEEYNNLMAYTAQLKALYTQVTDDAFKNHDIDEYPFAPAGIITSLGARLAELNFFEAGSTIPPKEDRVFTASFQKARTRFVWWEMNLEYLPHASRIDFEITTHYYPPDLVYYHDRTTFQTPCFILPEWESSNHAGGYGYGKAGELPVGTYRMEFWIEEEFIAQGQFEIQ